jgi:hypothetical protein
VSNLIHCDACGVKTSPDHTYRWTTFTVYRNAFEPGGDPYAKDTNIVLHTCPSCTDNSGEFPWQKFRKLLGDWCGTGPEISEVPDEKGRE